MVAESLKILPRRARDLFNLEAFTRDSKTMNCVWLFELFDDETGEIKSMAAYHE